jgi:hypothetical protein
MIMIMIGNAMAVLRRALHDLLMGYDLSRAPICRLGTRTLCRKRMTVSMPCGL